MTEWKAYGDVVRQIHGFSDARRTKALMLYSLSTLLRMGQAIREPDDLSGLSTACPISVYESKYVSQIRATSFLSDDEVALLALSQLYHRDLFIDIDKVDVAKTIGVIDLLITRGSLVFPNSHGRELYDRFNLLHPGTRLEYLGADDVISLTTGQSNGVYQVGHLIVGPIGILTADEPRMLPPTKKLPLWHCADPGCGMTHFVSLQDFKSKVSLARAELATLLSDREGPASDWQGAFATYSRVNDVRYFDLIPLIADRLDASEKATLFTALLENHEGKQLREVVGARLGSKVSQGSAEKVTNGLTENQVLQLITTLDSSTIVNALDCLVLSEKILVPKSEVRKTETPVLKRGRDMPTSISSLGVQSAKREPAAYLSRLIFTAYKETNNLDNLAWRCHAEIPNAATPLTYIAEEGPKKAIADLILPFKDIYEKVCLALSLCPLDLPGIAIEDTILWKAGFSVSRYDHYLASFRGSIISFKEAVLSLPNRANDIDRERIRAAAINSFVYAERFIEEFISFNAWLLTTDHFGSNRLQYNTDAALLSVEAVCGSAINAGGNFFIWGCQGGNALGTSLVYGRALIDKLSRLSETDRRQLHRPERDFPHYAAPTSDRFPFKHTQLWADCDPKSLLDYLEELSSVMSFLEKAKTAEIRNGVQHYRDKTKFPTKDSLLNCVDLLMRAVDTADIANLVPKQFWASTKEQDALGMSNWTMTDYNGREITITLPFASVGLSRPMFDKAYIIEGGHLLGKGAGKLIFELREISNYTKRWDGYRQVASVVRSDEEVAS